MRNYNRILVVFLLVALTAGSTVHVYATQPSQPSLIAAHAFVGDPLFGLTGLGTGEFFSKLPDEPTAMASTTKIVTLHIAVDALMGRIPNACGGSCQLQDLVTVSQNAVLGSSWVPSGSSVVCDAAHLNPNGSCSPGGSLQYREQVQFGDLLRAMMYPSGNDAAVAIAEHVAGNVETFVELMNDLTLPGHVTPQGLRPETHFTNPAGIDDWCPTFDPNTGIPEFCQAQYQKPVLNIGTSRHYTTARDLARIWVHGMQDDLFRQVVGFRGTYSFCTSLPGLPGNNPSCASIGIVGDKFYQLPTRPFPFANYPGWEGDKPGGTKGCGVCWVLSAERIGRRLVQAWMQGAGTDVKALFDFGFAELFHPDNRGVALDGFFVDDALVVLPNNRVVVAGITSTHAEKLSTWQVNVDNSQVTKLAENSVASASPPTLLPQTVRIQAIRLDNTHIITAKTVTTNILLSGDFQSVEISRFTTLSLWSISSDGTPSQIVHDVPAGTGSGFRLLPMSDTLFVSASVGKDSTLVLKSWAKVVFFPSLESKPITSLENLASLNPSTLIGEVDFARLGVDSLVTAVRRSSDGNIVNEVWSLDPNTGGITSLGSVDLQVQGSSLSIIRVPVASQFDEIVTPAYYATAFKGTDGMLRVVFSKTGFDFSGFIGISQVGDTQSTGYQIIGRPSLAPLGSSGMLITVRDSGSRQTLIVWEVRRNLTNDQVDDVFAPLQYRVSNHTQTDVAIRAVTISGLSTTHAEGDFVSATLTEGGFGGGGLLQVWAWRVGDRPF